MGYAYVLDCSVAISWLFSDEKDTTTKKLRKKLQKEAAIVPSLWSLKVANVLWKSENKGRITPYQSSVYKHLLFELPIEIDDKTAEFALRRTLELAREYKITVYDASYLELSLRHGCPLATLDKELVKAGKSAGVPVLS